MDTPESEQYGIRRQLSPAELHWLWFEQYKLEIDQPAKVCRIRAQCGNTRAGGVVYLKDIVVIVRDWSQAERVSTFKDKGCLASLLPEKPLPAAKRNIKSLKRTGKHGDAKLDGGGVEVGLYDAQGLHTVSFTDARLEAEAVVAPPYASSITMAEQRVISRKQLSDMAVSQLVCEGPIRLRINEAKRICQITTDVADFWIPESPLIYNVKIDIVNWSGYEQEAFTGGSESKDSCIDDCCCCCLFPVPIGRKRPKPAEPVRLLELAQHLDELVRIEKLYYREDKSITFDAVFKKTTTRYSFHNAQRQVGADCDSAVTYEYYELSPIEIYQVFLDEAPVDIDADQSELE
ncbi:hypothetical protein JW859_15295 [bacterium]|nr:hypothetical protein [bacterium]